MISPPPPPTRYSNGEAPPIPTPNRKLVFLQKIRNKKGSGAHLTNKICKVVFDRVISVVVLVCVTVFVHMLAFRIYLYKMLTNICSMCVAAH